MTLALDLENSNVAQAHEVRLGVDEKMLPDLIQGQIGKLNELDVGVKQALDSAAQAEKRAKDAGKLSAGWSLLGGKKKEAIEGLQEAGVELAGAVQSGAKAQKLSFEFQTRLAEITKYLFTLGVSNIAANRVVVRELEMRLSGASEEQLSELARKEVTSVIRQLKEQEDLLRKQEQLRDALKGHDLKIQHLLGRTDDLGQISNRQQVEITAVQQKGLAHQVGLETLGTALAEARAQAQEATANVLARIEALELRSSEQEVERRALAGMIETLGQVSKQQQESISALQHQHLQHQAALEKLTNALAQAGSQAEQATASLRAALNQRTALWLFGIIALCGAAYVLH